MYKSIRIVVLLTVTVFLIGSCNEKKPQQRSGGAGRQQGPIPVDGFIVSERTIAENIEVPGSLLPFEETQIRAEVGGRIVQLNINEGSAVEKGYPVG